jgi:hypothetical protein
MSKAESLIQISQRILQVALLPTECGLGDLFDLATFQVGQTGFGEREKTSRAERISLCVAQTL